MQKKSLERRGLNLLKILDPLLVIGVWMGVYAVRFYVFDGEQGQRDVFLSTGVILSLLVTYSFSREGLYRSRRLEGLGGQLLSLLRAHLISIAVFVVGLYFLAERRLSRTVIISYAIVFLLVQMAVRLGFYAWLRARWAQGRDALEVLFVGDSPGLLKDLETWRSRAQRGLRILGWIEDEGLTARVGVPRLSGSLGAIQAQVRPDLIVLGFSAARSARIEEILRDHHNDLTPIQIVSDVPYSILGLQVSTREGVPVMTLNQPDYPAVDLLVKRLMDLAGAGTGLLLLSPLLLFLGLGVKLSSPGPIFFAQERVGLDGRRFKMWKFRSMRVSAENESTWTTKDDPRKTKFGSFIRATSLDELPQLWNIFNGDMSMVGPRPEQPRYVEKFRHEIPAYMLRHKMKAGLTGWAQVNGWRGDTDLTKRIECDLFYIRHWSLWFDIKIIFLTFFKGFINRNAY